MKETLDKIMAELSAANPAAKVTGLNYEPASMYPFSVYVDGCVFLEKTYAELLERIAKHDPFASKKAKLIEAENTVTRLQTELANAAKEMEAK